MTDMCKTVFGINDAQINLNIARTNAYYGARNIKYLIPILEIIRKIPWFSNEEYAY